MPKTVKKQYPSKAQLRALKEAGWRRMLDGLCWQSPYDNYYYSPRAAVARQERRLPQNKPA